MPIRPTCSMLLYTVVPALLGASLAAQQPRRISLHPAAGGEAAAPSSPVAATNAGSLYLQPGTVAAAALAATTTQSVASPFGKGISLTPAPVSATAPIPAAMAPSARPALAVGDASGGRSRGDIPSTPLANLPPVPLIDAYGLQRYDVDGKPMFEPTIFQLRDRHGKPVVDDDRKPVFQSEGNLGYDARGHALRPPKSAAARKPHEVVIEHGSFMVNGIVGKVRLDYTINDFDYFYLYVPDEGAVIVSDHPFAGAIREDGAFRGKELVVHVDHEALKVTSDRVLLRTRPTAAYVAVDRSFMLPERFPVFGYGNATRDPYVWPGSQVDTEIVTRDAPPVPEVMRPRLAATYARTSAPASIPAQATKK